MEKYFFIGLGGCIGSISRYSLSGYMYRIFGDGFPYGTLDVNIVGCFIIGVLMSMFEERFVVQPNLRLFLTIGILGGFTTFSSFSFETVELVKAGNFLSAGINASASVFGCFIATWIGSILGKIL